MALLVASLLSLVALLGPSEANPDERMPEAEVELETEAPFVPPTARPLDIKCTIPCRVYLDGRRVAPIDLHGLPSGVHHIRIEADDHSLPPAHHDLVMTSGESALVLRYGPDHSEPVPSPPPIASSHDRPPPRLTGKDYRRGNELMEAGRITMTTGAVLFLGGTALFLGGVYLTDDFGASFVSVIASGVFVIPGGFVSLIVGGSLYGAGRRRINKPRRARLRATPLVGLGPKGGRVGFALQF